MNFGIFTKFCPLKIDLSGNTYWPQAVGFQKLANRFLAFLMNVSPFKCKRSSLRSQYWMRLFLWFSTTVISKVGESNICPLHMHEVVRGTWKSDEQSDHAGNSNLTMIPLATPSKPSNPCSTINHGLDAINTIIQHPFWTVAWENPNLLKYTHHRMKISDFLTKTLKSPLKWSKIW